jgi:ABC-type transport system involved in multi-copper enzyme maturation permease subunit
LIPLAPTLDFNPVLWRECRRSPPSPWLRAIWGLYALASLGVSIAAFVAGQNRGGEMAAFVNAFQFSIGLLLVNITAVASLFEERASGTLGVLMATPLSTSSIVWGKWLASFRVVLLVMLLPALLASGVLVTHPRSGGVDALGLLIALMFAYGAFSNSLGLALATWLPRFGVAMGVTVSLYALLAAGPVLLVLAVGHRGGNSMDGFANLSPWWGVGETTARISQRIFHENFGWKICWLVLYGAAALALTQATLWTFDRCIGRASGRDRNLRSRSPDDDVAETSG